MEKTKKKELNFDGISQEIFTKNTFASHHFNGNLVSYFCEQILTPKSIKKKVRNESLKKNAMQFFGVFFNCFLEFFFYAKLNFFTKDEMFHSIGNLRPYK